MTESSDILRVDVTTRDYPSSMSFVEFWGEVSKTFETYAGAYLARVGADDRENRDVRANFSFAMQRALFNVTPDYREWSRVYVVNVDPGREFDWGGILHLFPKCIRLTIAIDPNC